MHIFIKRIYFKWFGLVDHKIEQYMATYGVVGRPQVVVYHKTYVEQYSF